MYTAKKNNESFKGKKQVVKKHSTFLKQTFEKTKETYKSQKF